MSNDNGFDTDSDSDDMEYLSVNGYRDLDNDVSIGSFGDSQPICSPPEEVRQPKIDNINNDVSSDDDIQETFVQENSRHSKRRKVQSNSAGAIKSSQSKSTAARSSSFQAQDVIDVDQLTDEELESKPKKNVVDDESILVTYSDDEEEEEETLSELKSTDTAVDINEVITVRVSWRLQDITKFEIRKFQKLKEIYTHFAKRENVPEDRVLLTLREKIISPHDTPDSLDIGLTFIEGSLIAEGDKSVCTEPPVVQDCDENSLELKVQQKGVKDKMSIRISRTNTIAVLAHKIAEELQICVTNMKLMFDGEVVDYSDTPDSLDLEGGECFDLIVKNP